MTTTTSDRRARNRRRRERELRRRRPVSTGRRWLSLPAISAYALAGGSLLIVLAVINGRPAPPPLPAAPPVAGSFSGLPTDGFALGRADAPVTIDLYEDFQCPACRRWGEVVFPALAANELADGAARLVFHDFAFIGPESFDAARAGHAAAKQDRFWDLWATIYASQGAENSGALEPPRLVEMARRLGLDVDRFTADMAPAAAGPAVDASNAAAQRLGVNSTPTVVVDGRLLRVAGYDEIAAAIADAVAD
ncbi:MAG TPA: thioredoxin domain-containing protein [Candidatus Limnocylindrales bacterium]|nr:thioredoxin domain-containing protein [Candidatus Limnocylindrales bacterium]